MVYNLAEGIMLFEREGKELDFDHSKDENVCPVFSQKRRSTESAAELSVTNTAMLYSASAAGTKNVAVRSEPATIAGRVEESASTKMDPESAAAVCKWNV
jgi:hypothetical protein